MDYSVNKPLVFCPFPRFQKELFERLEQVITAQEPLLVYRPEAQSFVVMSISNLHALQEPFMELLAEQVQRDAIKQASREYYQKHRAQPR